MEMKSYAKLNLFLEITKKRKDGFHNIKSIFSRISLFDRIKINKTKKENIILKLKDNVNLGKLNLEDNLIYKAVKEFFKEFNIKEGLEIFLEKNIPVGAGLGGGSSNCATTLNILSLMYKKNSLKDKKKIFNIAKRLGSDVPFFLSNNKFAICSGRGEKIKSFKVKAKLPYILLIWPDTFVSTKKVYSNFKIADKKEIIISNNKLNKFKSELFKKNKEIKFKDYLFNRLETGVLPYYKRINNLKEKFDDRAVLMSGSGSSIFVLSYKENEILNMKRKISSLHKFNFLAKFI